MKPLGFTNSYFFINNTLAKTNTEIFNPENEISVYEVIKIISGIPLFFESHIARLKNSLKLSNIKGYSITNATFIKRVKQLCDKNRVYFGNIELRIVKSDDITNCYLGFTPHTYPPPLSYFNGVDTLLLNLERNNPNAKVKNTKARIKADRFLTDKNVFEVILVDTNNYITEGSRSNLFFIKNNIVYTAPTGLVLPGITRKHVMKALKSINISIIDKSVSIEELDNIDAVFLCGTSPGVLPIKQIDNYKFNVKNSVINSLMLEFNNIIKQYIINQ